MYEVWLLGKRLVLVAASLFFSRLMVWLIFLLVVLFASFAAIQLRLAPFRLPAHNRLELQLDSIVIFLLLLGAFFWADDFPNPVSHALFVVMAIAAICLALLLVLRTTLREFRGRRKQAAAVGVEMTEAGGSGSARSLSSVVLLSEERSEEESDSASVLSVSG